MYNPLKVILSRFRFEHTLPQLYDVPTHIAQLDTLLIVAILIALYFCLPKFCIRLGQAVVSASFVSMPKTAVDENHSAIFGQYNIGGARQIFDVQTISEALCKKVFAHYHFGLRVLAANVRHTAVALFGCQSVGHIRMYNDIVSCQTKLDGNLE